MGSKKYSPEFKEEATHDLSKSLTLFAIIIAEKSPPVEYIVNLRFFTRCCPVFPKRVTIAPHCGQNALAAAHLNAQNLRL